MGMEAKPQEPEGAECAMLGPVVGVVGVEGILVGGEVPLPDVGLNPEPPTPNPEPPTDLASFIL